jgi:hypothetical protein
MLTPFQIEMIHALPLPQRQKRYAELSSKISNLVVLTPAELQELIILRDLLQNAAQDLRQFGKTAL